LSSTVNRPEQLDILERPRDPRAERRDAAGVRSRLLSPNRTAPESGLYSRVITLKSVVLPAPFGPISPTICPASTSERDVVDRHDPAEPPRHVANLEQRHRG